MLKIRYILRLIGAFVARFKGLLVLGVAVGIAMFFITRFIGPSVLGKAQESIGIAGRYQTENLPQEILSLIGDGLTKIDEAGFPEPNLAKSWETPDKGRTWIFQLREDAEWQDGKKVTSSSINYNFTDVEVERPDESTIVFKLKEPFSPFPVIVSRPVFKQGLLGTSEWRVTKASLVGNYVQTIIMKNETKQKKVFRFYPTEERAKLALKLGEVDKLEGTFTQSPFDKWPTMNISNNINEEQIVSIFFNTKDQLLLDKSMRQALDYAIDKSQFDGERALSPISPKSWAYNPQVKRYDYDPERAKELIGEASTDNEIEIKLVSSPVLLPVAEKIADYWKQAGVNTIVQVSSGIPTDFQAYLAILDVPKDPDQYIIWHSTQNVSNISSFQNPRIDKLLEDGRVELKTEERKKIYLDFQRFLVEELPAAFLYHPTTYAVERK